MKKYLTYIIAGTLAFTGCDAFLDLEPQSILTEDNAYNDADDWNQNLTSAYGSLQNVFIGKYTITLGEFGTDEVEPFDLSWAAYTELLTYTFNAQHAFFDNHYRECYGGIKRANVVIDMPKDAVDEADYNSMVMQARFLRAIFYFDLVKMYGGVPLWLKSSIDRDNIMIGRSSVDEVYKVIEEDMKAALGLPESWPNAEDKGRATSLAAKAFLARIYLQWGKPDLALQYCRELEGKFHLYEDYADIFDPNNKNQEYENIFEIQSMHSGAWGQEGSIQHSYWGPRNVGGPTNFGGWGGFGPTQYLYDSYDDNDKRKEAFFFTEFNGVPQTPPSTKKFFDEVYGNQIEDDQLNFTLIRYADVLLMRAEALNSIGDQTDEKYTCLNQVRRRAGLADITAADNLSQEEFADAVLEERLHELCCEHLRRFDLIRFGKLKEAVYAATDGEVEIKDYHVLYPIPESALNANDAIPENNPGY